MDAPRLAAAQAAGQAAFRELTFGNVSHEYRTGAASTPTLRDVSFAIERGDFVTVLGPSGCGKSTLFNLATGLIQPTSGTVEVNGATLQGINSHVAYMFQQPALLEWRTVLQNVMLGPEFLKFPRRTARTEALQGLKRFNLEQFAQSRPSELSGGMKQRVALLRTYLTHRSLLLLDEPFGAVDAMTRLQMQQVLLDTWQEDRRTVLFITHDVDEAILLGDRMVVLSERPASVALELEVPFDRPRQAQGLVTDPGFINCKREILASLQAK